MSDFDMSNVPSEELSSIPGEERLGNLMQLIEAQKGEFDAAKRRAILKKIDARLLELCPYVLLWQNGSHRLLYWNRFGMPKNPLARFGDPDAVIVYWWFDRDRARALDEARKSGEPLPAAPADVVYGD